MARARNIKPALFKNEVLGTADPIHTLLFEGLWLLADREGRLEDRPLRIKGEIFPYRDGIDVDGSLTWLHDNGFIVRYSTEAGRFIAILQFVKHQNPHKNEPESDIPAPTLRKSHRRSVPSTSEKNQSTPEKIGTAPADSLLLIPDSPNLIPDSGKEERAAEPPPPAKSPSRFVPPTVDQVADYCRERSSSIDPQQFVDFYVSKGWRVGSQPMRDWKACVRTWETRDRNGGGRSRDSPPVRRSKADAIVDEVTEQAESIFGG